MAKRAHLVFVVWLVVSFGTVLHAATVRPLSLESIIDQADRVAYTRVLSNRSYWDPLTQTIWTETELEVLDNLKGAASRTVRVSEPGGILGNRGVVAPGVPRFEPNQEVVVFLYNGAAARLRVLGLQQGVFEVSADPADGIRIVKSLGTVNEVRLSTTILDPRSPSATPTRRLSDFLEVIRGRVGGR